jgi:type IX secretion system PorP/SprF family membrane protein
MKKDFMVRIIIVFAFVLFLLSGNAQDINFSQYFNNRQYYNPAFTGINNGLRTDFSFRNEFHKLPNDYNSYCFSVDFGEKTTKGLGGGVGFIFTSDNGGLSFIRKQVFGLSLAGKIPVAGNILIQVGLKAAFIQEDFDMNDFVFTDQINGRFGEIYLSQFTHPDKNSRTFPDFGAGTVVQISIGDGKIKGNAGLAVDHLFQPDESFLSTVTVRLPRKYVLHSDMEFVVIERGTSGHPPEWTGDPLKICPGFILQSQDKTTSYQVGMNVQLFNIIVGSWYKGGSDEMIGSSVTTVVGPCFYLGKGTSIKLVYSHDVSLSGELKDCGGSHEITLGFGFGNLKLFR